MMIDVSASVLFFFFSVQQIDVRCDDGKDTVYYFL